MDSFDPAVLIPILEALSEVAAHIPMPWVTVLGVVLGAAALVLRKVYRKPGIPASAPEASPVVELPARPVSLTSPSEAPSLDAREEAIRQRKVIELVNKTLKKD